MIGALDCKEGVIFEVRIVSFVRVSMSSDVKTHSIVDHCIEIVVQN
jgi:hypothetical protein